MKAQKIEGAVALVTGANRGVRIISAHARGGSTLRRACRSSGVGVSASSFQADSGNAMKRTWTIIGVSDVPGSFKWYQSLFGQPETRSEP